MGMTCMRCSGTTGKCVSLSPYILCCNAALEEALRLHATGGLPS